MEPVFQSSCSVRSAHDLKTFITRLRLRVEDIPADTQRARAAADLDAMTARTIAAVLTAHQLRWSQNSVCAHDCAA